jgi:membrane protease YdiL (CAAX protease family)
VNDLFEASDDYIAQPDEPWLRPELVASWRWIAAMVTILLGPGIIIGAAYGLTHETGDFLGMIRDRPFIANGAYEAAMLGLFLLVLKRRGWTPADLKFRISALTTLQGFGLTLITYFTLVVFMMGLLAIVAVVHPAWIAALTPKLPGLHAGSIELSWPVIITFTLVNAFYEELVYMTLLFNQTAAKAGVAWAVTATIGARLLIHTYQGTSHAGQIGVWAVVFALGYVRCKSVWPLIVAHATIDLISLSALKLIYG